MAEISASMVKELREKSGAGMMDCKKALNETNGDMDAALEFLKKNGQAKAEKKASRIAAEGICCIAKEGNTAAVVEVNSETDFVAKNEKFQNFVKEVAEQALKSNAADITAFMAETWVKDSSKTVNDVQVEMTATIGEKISIRRFAKVNASGAVATYVHGGGRIAVIVEGNVPGTEEALTNVAMQIAAMNPQYISREDISAEEMKKLEEISERYGIKKWNGFSRSDVNRSLSSGHLFKASAFCVIINADTFKAVILWL